MNALEQQLRPARFAVILAVMVVIQFPTVLLGFDTFFFRDFGFFGYPLAAYHRESFWAGEIPLWNPYNNAGLPFLAQWNTLVLYPGSLIYLLLPLPWSLNLFCILHQYLAGLGMYFLARESAKSNLGAAIAGTAFAFGGLLLCSLKWPNNIAAFGLMPWTVLCCIRAFQNPKWRQIGFAALVGGAQMLAGAPEVILLTWVIIGAMGIGEAIAQKRLAPVFALAAIVGLISAIAAAQLLPFLDLLKQSQRTGTFVSAEWPMPVWGLINFIAPLYKTFPSYHGVPAQPGQYWTSTYYIPLLALALAFFARGWRAAVLWGLAVFGTLLALGDNFVVYPAFRKAAPFLSFMRFPIKFVVLAIFLVPLLAAYGISHPAIAKKIGRFRRPALLGLGLVALIFVDGRMHAPNQNPVAPVNVYAPRKWPAMLGRERYMISPTAALKLDHLKIDDPAQDILTSRNALFCNANLIDLVPKVDGFYSLYIREPAQFIDAIYASTNRDFPVLEKLLAASHRSSSEVVTNWVQLGEAPWITGGQQPIFATRADALRTIFSGDFDPAMQLTLPPEATNTTGAVVVKISEISWKPHKVTFKTSSSASAWIFISQAWHPNWRATVNGIATPIFRANHAFQGLHVPGKDSVVELTYVDGKFRIGSIVSIVGVLIACGCLRFR